MEHYFKSGFFVDIGAHNGVHNNKTLSIAQSLDENGVPLWKGICIEANPLIFPKLRESRETPYVKCVQECVVSEKNSGKDVEFLISDHPSIYNSQAPWGLACGIVPDDDFYNKPDFRFATKEKIDKFCDDTGHPYESIKIKAKSLSQVLEEANCPRTIEYMKLDIEGAEEEVLSDFCFAKYDILFLVVEYATERLYKILCDNDFIHIGSGVDSHFVNKKNPNFSRQYPVPFTYTGGHQ